MKLLTSFLLVGLLALWMGFPSATGSDLPTEHPIQQKPGVCPFNDCNCIQPEPDSCRTDRDCNKNKKCCYYCCSMNCVDPA